MKMNDSRADTIEFQKGWMKDVVLLQTIAQSLSVSRAAIAILVKNRDQNTIQKHFLLIIPRERDTNAIKLEKNCGLLGFVQEDKPPESIDLESIIMDANLLSKKSKKSSFVEGVKLEIADIISADEGDLCPSCNKVDESSTNSLEATKAIEVGHTFYLGTKYSSPLSCTFKNKDDKVIPMEMGCYGIGVSRLIAAVAEVTRDKDGLRWPESISPFRGCLILSLGKESSAEIDDILKLVLDLNIGLKENDLIVDDRDFSFGFKIKDALVVGYPYIFIAGKSFLETGQIEVRKRW